MYIEDFIPQRLAKLRMEKGVSARDMSFSLGFANNYINSIENKKSFPSVLNLFYICEYLGITLSEFFDEGDVYPLKVQELVAQGKQLDNESLSHIIGLMKIINKKPQP